MQKTASAGTHGLIIIPQRLCRTLKKREQKSALAYVYDSARAVPDPQIAPVCVHPTWQSFYHGCEV
jgi:hypothetical protein